MRRTWTRFLAHGALAALLMLAGGLFVPQVSNASSVYDTTYQTTDTLSVIRNYSGTCPSIDLRYNWKKYILDASTWRFGADTWAPEVKESFEEALENGRWGVSAYKGSGVEHVEVYWTEDSSLSLSWSFDGSNYGVYATNVNVAEITCAAQYLGGNNRPTLMAGYPDGLATAIVSHPVNGWYSYFAQTDYPNYPSGYEGTSIRSTPPAAKYVAMGDSFSSGEGNPAFETGSDYSDVNECHRSSQAYPRLLQADTNLDLGLTAFVACSGATTSDVLYGGSDAGNWDEGPQVDALSEETDIVTITIGGNDVGFQEYLPSCVGFCGPNTLTYEAIIDNIESPAFQDNLETTYEEILDRAENAMVYVVDYPYMTAEDAETCGVLDFSGGRGVQIALNSTIETAVSNVRAQSEDYLDRLRYVDVNTLGSPFEGGHLCNGGESDFGSFTFHPNTQGHIDYASILANEIG